MSRAVRRQIGQLIVAGFDGPTIPAELAALAREFDLGGVILFARNIDAPLQVAELAYAAKQLAHDMPPWVSIDQEGGRVQRLRAPCTEWPPGRDPRTVRRFGAGGTVRPCVGPGAARRRHHSRLCAGPRRPYEPVEPGNWRPRVVHRRGADSGAGRDRRARGAGRRNRRLRQALSGTWRHLGRFARGTAGGGAGAAPARGGGAAAVPRGDRRGRCDAHDGACPLSRARRGAACHAVARGGDGSAARGARLRGPRRHRRLGDGRDRQTSRHRGGKRRGAARGLRSGAAVRRRSGSTGRGHRTADLRGREQGTAGAPGGAGTRAATPGERTLPGGGRSLAAPVGAAAGGAAGAATPIRRSRRGCGSSPMRERSA